MELDLSTIKKGNLQTKYGVVEKYVGYEIAGCFEQYAFQSDNLAERINYLDWAKYYYGVSKSAKSYYLSAYTNYIKLVNSIIIGDDLKEDIKDVIDKCKILITELELQTTILENFPVIEKIILLLKVISSIKSKIIDSYSFLLELSLSDTNKDHDYIRNLAAAILSYNLIDEGSSNILIERLKERIVLLLRRSLSSFADEEMDSDEINRRILVEKLINSGEKNNIEFKATLDVPVLSKENKLNILNEKSNLSKTSIEEDKKNILKRIEDLSKINISDKKLIDIVNLSAMKTVAAFANTAGGYLLIGIDEDEFGNPYLMGIDADLKKHKNKDGIRLRLDSMFQKYFGNGMMNGLIRSMEFVTYNGKEIILIEVPKSNNEIFVNAGDDKKFYIRRQASTVELKSYELYEYLKTRES